MEEYLAHLGIAIPALLAGFLGGLASSIVTRQAGAGNIIGSIIVGALASNYLGDPFAKMVGMTPPLPAADFMIGLIGMFACQAIIKAAQEWRPKLPGSGP